MPFQLVVLQGRSASQAIKIGGAVTTVGRQEGCQLRVRSSQVSRKHCQIFEKNGLLLVKDLGSSNGTFVNGKKIDEQQVMEPGDELTVGNIRFRVERSDGVPTGVPAAAAPAQPVSTGDDDVIELEADDSTEAAIPVAAKPAPAPSKKDAKRLEEEAAAYLLDIELDEEDKL